jgi:hypothetical protein
VLSSSGLLQQQQQEGLNLLAVLLSRMMSMLLVRLLARLRVLLLGTWAGGQGRQCHKQRPQQALAALQT